MNLFIPPEPLEDPPPEPLEDPPLEPTSWQPSDSEATALPPLPLAEAPVGNKVPLQKLNTNERRDYKAVETTQLSPNTLDSEPTSSAHMPLEDVEAKKIRKKMAQNKRIRELKSLKRVVKKHYLMITRFNDYTHSEMLEYCKHIKGVQCCYGVPRLVSNFVNPDGIMFVLEMNNDIDKIVGIGMVRNVAIAGKHRIYEEENYNRYAYLGKTRIAREQMTPDEEELMKILDNYCFKGCRHQKRGQGINFFPPNVEIPEYNAVEFIIGMFKRRL